MPRRRSWQSAAAPSRSTSAGRWLTSTVDCPTDLVGLIRQRRRWLNGTFFALVFALHKWGAIYEHTKHSVFRKFTFFIEIVYLSIIASFGTWFQLSLLYIALSTVINEALQGNADIIETAIEIIYLFLLLTLQISRSRADQPEPAQGPTAAWAAPRPARENVGEVRSM